MQTSTKNPQAFEENDFICPVTGELIHDPVLASDGYIYERDTILKLFQNNQKSLRTNKPFANNILALVSEQYKQALAARHEQNKPNCKKVSSRLGTCASKTKWIFISPSINNFI